MIRWTAQAILLLLFTSPCGFAQDVSSESLPGLLKSVEDLYYTAEFEEASKLLQDIDAHVPAAARPEDLKKLRLYQALVEVARDHPEAAISRFWQLLTLDPAFSLNPAEHAPKIIGIFLEAQKTYGQNRCTIACTECEAARNRGDIDKAVQIIKSLREECECVRRLSGAVADSLVERGTVSLQAGEYSRASNEFKAALDIAPGNRAAEYSLRAADQLESALTAALAEWKHYFDSRDFTRAKWAYERVLMISLGGKSKAAEQMKTEYQNLFERDRKRWVEACTRQDPLGADSVRQQIRASDPTGDLGTAVLRQMRSCPASGCTELPSVQVLSKLKSRIYPKIDPALRPYESKLTVKVRIDDKGRVTVLDIDNPVGNRAVSEAVKGAVEQWKFDPALAAGSATGCVVTEFFIEFEK